MLDIDFLKLAWVASVVYGGDIWQACRASQQFSCTDYVNMKNLNRILLDGFSINERTNTWLVGKRRFTVEQYVSEVAAMGIANPDIRNGWNRPVLIRRAHL